MIAMIAPRFARKEAVANVTALVMGLMAAAVGSKNCWTLAEHAGHLTPDKLQHLLARAKWDAAMIAADVREMVVAAFGTDDAILVVDETGDLKKGTKTVGVHRQYTGTAGRIENSQVAVYMTYTSDKGHALIDRRLYLPTSWTDHRERCDEAGVPAEVGFATKTELAAEMITDALDAGVRCSWVAGDEVYGASPELRALLHDRTIGYVLAVASNRRVPTAAGPMTVAQLAADTPTRSWQRLSAGAGTKGDRLYSWAWHTTTEDPGIGQCWVLVRRNDTTGELAFYRCYSPTPVPLAVLVKVAGRRWTVEESFQSSKGLTGLDQHQVRTWTSWHRWTVLVMLAHAILAITTAEQRAHETTHPSLIRLSINEFQRLLAAGTLTTERTLTRLLEWSLWRRRHQFRAQACHQNRRSQT